MTKYYHIVVMVLIGILIFVGYLSKNLSQGQSIKLESGTIPEMQLWDLDSSSRHLTDFDYSKSMILTLVSSECQICHDQIVEFHKRGDKLGTITMVVLSYQDIEDIKQFSRLFEMVNTKFLKVEYLTFVDHFGDVSTPQTYLYDQKGENNNRKTRITTEKPE